VLGHGGKQTRPTFKFFSLGETEGVRTLTNVEGMFKPPPFYNCQYPTTIPHHTYTFHLPINPLPVTFLSSCHKNHL